jgi:hypothetical protein
LTGKIWAAMIHEGNLAAREHEGCFEGPKRGNNSLMKNCHPHARQSVCKRL